MKNKNKNSQFMKLFKNAQLHCISSSMLFKAVGPILRFPKERITNINLINKTFSN